MDTDEVVVAPGTYHQAIDFLGKAITLRSSDGAEVTIIDGTGFFTHVVQCVSGEGPDTVLRGFVITGGLAPSFGEDHGGGMLNSESSPTVRQCTFAGNEAKWGGGMANVNCSPTVIDCAFIGNTAEFGGGMSNTTADPTVINCTFTANHAVAGAQVGRGGGMYNEDVSDPVVINCGFVGNTATVGAGMANRQQSAPTVINCTFHGNTGSGMTNNNFSGPLVNNSIFWGNRPTQIDGASLATVRFSDVQGGFAGTGNIDADPLFVDPDNGDLRLQPGSPCIDAGDNTAVPKDITTDLDGNPRFVDDPDTPDSGVGDPPIVDMGAYEFQVPCPWDLDGDGNVFVTDLLVLLMDFGSCGGSPADFDGDGCVTVMDLLTLLGNWGPCPGSDCVWDVNGDGTVDETDLRLVLDNFGPCDGCPEDVNGDGVVNGQDVAAVATHFGPCP